MKQFNLEEYLANPSRKVVTRDGRNARIICTDAKVAYGEGEFPIIALIQKDEKYEELPYAFQKDGSYLICKTDDKDLFFAPEKHEGYVNVYRDTDRGTTSLGAVSYASRKEAEGIGKFADDYVATARIEWEE